MNDYTLFRTTDGSIVFQCECHNVCEIDNQTECSRCGARYETHVEQTVPPTGEA